MKALDFGLSSEQTTLNTNQSIENAGVAFVKGAFEGNEFFEKKKTVMYDEQVWTNKAKD